MRANAKYLSSLKHSQSHYDQKEHPDLDALAAFLRQNGLKPLYARTSRAKQPETPWCLVEREDGSRVPISEQNYIAAWLRTEAVA